MVVLALEFDVVYSQLQDTQYKYSLSQLYGKDVSHFNLILLDGYDSPTEITLLRYRLHQSGPQDH